MQAFWTLALRVLLVLSSYITTAGVLMLFRTGFPPPAFLGVFMFGFIGFRVLQTLNKDKSKICFPPQGDTERTLLVVGSLLGVVAGFAMKVPT